MLMASAVLQILIHIIHGQTYWCYVPGHALQMRSSPARTAMPSTQNNRETDEQLGCHIHIYARFFMFKLQVPHCYS